jgi:hypothetical protein
MERAVAACGCFTSTYANYNCIWDHGCFVLLELEDSIQRKAVSARD